MDGKVIMTFVDWMILNKTKSSFHIKELAKYKYMFLNKIVNYI